VSVLVVAAHPDDEVLGCGGTVAKHAQRGEHVAVCFLSDGVMSRGSGPEAEAELQRRREAALSAAGILGVAEVRFGDLPDNRMDGLELLTVARAVERHIREFAPTTIYTHFSGDLNVDHRLTHEAVMTACRPQPTSGVVTVLQFETTSSTEWRAPSASFAFQPDWFVDIASTIDTKLRALEAYSEELRAWPHARSREALEHLARWRGATIGRQAAEAFVLARHIT
jgi:LmbE family N-acetylglucosaminyl deacetylase